MRGFFCVMVGFSSLGTSFGEVFVTLFSLVVLGVNK